MELATVLGPSSTRALRGHSVLTSWCSPRRILRTFSAPVTRISGRPSKCVLKTLPYFSRRDDWKSEPCGNTPEASQGSQRIFDALASSLTLGTGHPVPVIPQHPTQAHT